MFTYTQTPDSFHVWEDLFYEPSGSGAHLFVQIEKRNMSTGLAKRRLSESTGVPLNLIKHSGKKDGAATAVQWLSWPEAAQKRPPSDLDDLAVLSATRHENALSIGHVRCNRFRLLLARQEQGMPPARPPIENAFPNFYGRQRFGSSFPGCEGMAAVVDRPVRDKERISVVQAALFNQYLVRRLRATGDQARAGDWWTATNGKRCFQAEMDEALALRYGAGEIVPTGPIYGYKTRFSEDELAMLQELGLSPERFRKWGKVARGARRPLFITPVDTAWEVGESQAVLSFTLPSGAYATVYLIALFMPELLLSALEQWPDFRVPVRLE